MRDFVIENKGLQLVLSNSCQGTTLCNKNGEVCPVWQTNLMQKKIKCQYLLIPIKCHCFDKEINCDWIGIEPCYGLLDVSAILIR